MISRRNFLETAASFAAAVELPFAAYGASGPDDRLRLGVISDLHIKGAGSTGTFERALAFFGRQKVDGVICAGDLATSGVSSELERVAAAWFKVFPDGRRIDGAPVSQLFIYGDHDMGGYAWRESAGILSEAELRAQTIPNRGPGEVWERSFGEKWAPVQIKTVKGYTFVLAHHPRHSQDTAFGNHIPEAASALAEGARRAGGRPFFYVQHRPIPGLAGEESVWRAGDPRIAAELRRYPDCVALTGHTHRNCADGQMVWQGEFTALNVPCLRYLCMRPGRENSGAADRNKLMDLMRPRDGQQGYLMDVSAREIAVRRLDFAYSTGAAVAPPWRIPLPAPGACPYAFENRERVETAPRFQPGARIRARERDVKDRAGNVVPAVVVAFPPAFSTRTTPRAFDYEVVAESAAGRVVKRVFSGKCYLPEPLDAGNVECVFARSEIGDGAVGFTVRPCGCFGAKGAALKGRLA